MKKQNTLKKALGMAISAAVISAQLIMPVSAAGTIIQNNFTGGELGSWAIGSQKDGAGALTAENGYATLSLIEGQTIDAYNDQMSRSPDAKLELSEPFVLGTNNEETVIRTRIRTNFVPNNGNTPRIFFSVNYTDDAADESLASSANRYAGKYHAFWALDKTKVLNYSHWNKTSDTVATVEAYNGLATDTWYTVETHLWSDATGITYVSVRVFDKDGTQLSTGEANVADKLNNPLRSIKQIENIGIEMMGSTSTTITAPQGGYNVDFDSFAIYHATDANSLVADDSISGDDTVTEPEEPIETTTEPRKYTFTDGIADWETGLSNGVSQTLTVEGTGNKYAELKAGAAVSPWNDAINTPDAKLVFDPPYLLGENTTTVISTKFRTNGIQTNALKALMINYDDSTAGSNYHGSKYNILWGQRQNRFDNFAAWSNGNVSVSQLCNNNEIANDTWYIAETALTTGSAGTITGVKVTVKDSTGNTTLGTANVSNVASAHPLAGIKYIENLGLAMLSGTSAETNMPDNLVIDFDDFAVYNSDTVGIFSLAEDTFLETMSAVQIQLGVAPASDYELSVQNEDGDDVDFTADFDNTTNILTVTFDEVQGEGDYTLYFDNGYISKEVTLNVKGVTTEDIVYDFESGLNGWNQRNNLNGVTFAQAEDGERKFARITVPANAQYTNWGEASAINKYPVVKIDLERNYKFVPGSTVVISSDIRTSDDGSNDEIRAAMTMNNDKSNGGQWYNMMWFLRTNSGSNKIYNYSFTSPGNSKNEYAVDWGWTEAMYPNTPSPNHVDGCVADANKWYTVKMVYNIGDNGTIETANHYIFDEDGRLVDAMTKDAQIADSLDSIKSIERLSIELIGNNKAVAAETTYDIDNVSIKSYNKTDIIDENEKTQTEVKANTDYYGKFTYFNDITTEENKNVQGLIAVYENVNGAYKLTGVKIVDKSIAPGTELTFATPALNSENGTMIKSFLWDTATQAPLCKETKIGQ